MPCYGEPSVDPVSQWGTIEYVACGTKVENTAFSFTLKVRHLYDAAETLIRQTGFACWLLRLPQDTSQ
jgi:hypothetical protein